MAIFNVWLRGCLCLLTPLQPSHHRLQMRLTISCIPATHYTCSSCRGVIMVLKLSPNLRQLATGKKPEEISTSGKKTAGGGLNIAKVHRTCDAGLACQSLCSSATGPIWITVSYLCQASLAGSRYIPHSMHVVQYLENGVMGDSSHRSWGWTSLRHRRQVGLMAKLRQSSARQSWSTTRWRLSSRT